MKKKNLVIFLPSIEGGGVEKNAFIITNYLAEKMSISVITASKEFKNKFDNNIEFISPRLGIWNSFGRKTKYLVCLFLLLKKYLKKKNFLVMSFQANIYCIILCKILNIKVIVRSNSSPTGWANNFFKNIIFRTILKKANKVIVNSIEFKKQLNKKFSVDSKCIYNPLNIHEIKKKSKVKMSKIYKNKKSLKIINIGRLVDQKDQLTMLKALKLISKKIKFEAVIVGKGILKNKLENYVRRNNISNQVKFINFKQNVYPLINQADILILTSLYEGLPNVLLEAIALKKFPISTNCMTGPKEILYNGKGGLLFKIKDHEQLGRKIIYYLKNKQKCKIMLKKSYKGLNRFDKNLNLQKYLNEINKLI